MKTKDIKNSIFTLWICLILFVTSCNNSEQIVNCNLLFVNDTTCIIQGEQYQNLTENISLRLDSVPSDSRCPIGAMCFWQGNATAAFTFTKGNVKHSLTLNTMPTFRVDTFIENYNIKLVALSQPSYSKTYTATVLIRK